jgi:CelD/BcsL family acetyltransferase involved in cellulose biosynthesis
MPLSILTRTASLHLALPREARPDQSFEQQALASLRPSGEVRIRTEIVDAETFSLSRDPWRALCARAAACNVFMEPDVALAVHHASPDTNLRVVLAWLDGEGGTLLGAWVVSRQRSRQAWPARAAVTPINPVAYIGTPVVDRALFRPVLRSMLLAIRADPDMPDLVQIGDFHGRLHVDLLAVVEEAGLAATLVETRRRARLVPEIGSNGQPVPRPRGRGSRRKLDRLKKAGDVSFTHATQLHEAVIALEEFLQLESAGWKGERGSALASSPGLRDFSRRMVQGMAIQGLADVQALRLDGNPVAMMILLRSGPEAFTWRMAYDEAFALYSPGILLLNHISEGLLADTSITATDSGNHDDKGIQAERWPDRHEMLDILIDLRPGRGGATLQLLGLRERTLRRARQRAKDARDRLRAKGWIDEKSPWPRPKLPPRWFGAAKPAQSDEAR